MSKERIEKAAEIAQDIFQQMCEAGFAAPSDNVTVEEISGKISAMLLAASTIACGIHGGTQNDIYDMQEMLAIVIQSFWSSRYGAK